MNERKGPLQFLSQHLEALRSQLMSTWWEKLLTFFVWREPISVWYYTSFKKKNLNFITSWSYLHYKCLNYAPKQSLMDWVLLRNISRWQHSFYVFEDQDAIFGGKGKWTEFYLEHLVLRFINGWKKSTAEGQDQGGSEPCRTRGESGDSEPCRTRGEPGIQSHAGPEGDQGGSEGTEQGAEASWQEGRYPEREQVPKGRVAAGQLWPRGGAKLV